MLRFFCLQILFMTGVMFLKILNIHGFRGSAENAAFVALTELGHDVVAPAFDYDAVSPLTVAEKLRGMIG